MIIKGHSTAGHGLAHYLQKSDKNECIEVLRTRGDVPRELSETLKDWSSDYLITNCSKPLYHAQLSPNCALSMEELNQALKIFENEMGLENQPRVLVKHKKNGREHLHAVYSRIDENGHAISDSWNYPRHEKASRQIELELGMQKVQGVFIDPAAKRPERTPNLAEIQQAERHNLDLEKIKSQVGKLYKTAHSGEAFVAALESYGYKLAQGDRGGFVIVDMAGCVHSVLRLVDVKLEQLRETLREFELQSLPSVEDARSLQKMRLPVLEKQEAIPELSSEVTIEKPVVKAMTRAERNKKLKLDLAIRKVNRYRGEVSELDFELGRGLSRSLQR